MLRDRPVKKLEPALEDKFCQTISNSLQCIAPESRSKSGGLFACLQNLSDFHKRGKHP